MANEDTLGVLRATPIIGLFEENALRVLANVADARRLRSGEVLFRQNERSDGGYVVLAGEIAVGREGDDAGVAHLGPGGLIGKVALFLRMQRPAAAVATEPSTVLRISPTLMKRVLQEYPSAAEGMSRILADDLEGLATGLDRVEKLFAAAGDEV